MCAPVNRKVKIDDKMKIFVFIYRVEFIYSYVDFFYIIIKIEYMNIFYIDINE